MEPPPGRTAPPPVRLTNRSARRWLVAVGVAYAAVQLSSFDLDRAPSWDEAIYLSQVTPGAEAYHFAASRARGITILAAPFAAAGSPPAVRAGMTVLAAIALVGAFLPWVPTIGAGGPAGAAFLASSWTALFYGSEVMPNLWVALAGVGALGLVVLPAGDRSSREDLGAASILLLAGLLRPFDAVLVAGAAVAAALTVGRRPSRTAAVLVAGVGAGCLPWLVEMATRYGGVGPALGQAIAVAHVTVPDPWTRILQYLATADGPTLGPVAHPGIPLTGILTVVAPGVAAAVGTLAARGSRVARPLVACLGAAALVSAAYVGLVGGIAPRFLLPATAFVAVPAGCGVVACWRRAVHPVPRAIFLVPLLAWPAWQGWVAVRLESSAARQRADVHDVGRTIASHTGGRRCVVASVVAAPQLGYASGCRGRPIVDLGTVDEVFEQEADRGVPRIFLVAARPLPRTPPGTSGRWSADEPATGPLTIYRVDR